MFKNRKDRDGKKEKLPSMVTLFPAYSNGRKSFMINEKNQQRCVKMCIQLSGARQEDKTEQKALTMLGWIITAHNAETTYTKFYKDKIESKRKNENSKNSFTSINSFLQSGFGTLITHCCRWIVQSCRFFSSLVVDSILTVDSLFAICSFSRVFGWVSSPYSGGVNGVKCDVVMVSEQRTAHF